LVETHNEKASAVILAKYLKKTLNYHNLRLRDAGVDIKHLRRILDLLQEHYIYDDVAELILRELVYDTVKKEPVRTVDQVLRDMKYEKPLEDEHLKKLVNDAIRDNPKAVRDYEGGRQESFNFLVGQVMKKTGRHANANRIREMLKVILG